MEDADQQLQDQELEELLRCATAYHMLVTSARAANLASSFLTT